MYHQPLRTIVLILLTSLVWGCSVVKQYLPSAEDPAITNQRAEDALASLAALENVDAFIKLDNTPLQNQIEETLQAQAALSGELQFQRLRVRFARQHIELDADIDIANGSGPPIEAQIGGDVFLTFAGDQLAWLPNFNQLKVVSKDFEFESQRFAIATPELEAALLQRVNRDITEAVMVLGRNVVQINPLPLGQVDVGATVTHFNRVSARNQHELGGVFVVAGSTIMIEPRMTSIALDLHFIPSISACPSDVFVSRATFAREIKNREPIGITRFLEADEAASYFFTEISGATRPTAVVHYWFADGRPVALEELPVEPSYRWRTWSSFKLDRRTARNWQVIVVEKQTGCILHTLAIRNDAGIGTPSDKDTNSSVTFDTFKTAFSERLSGFSINDERPEVGLIEVPRSFLSQVLHESMKDIQVAVTLDMNRLPARKLAGQLRPVRVNDVVCEERQCAPPKSCDSGFSKCVRQRDNRDCTTCLIRNPLNNRCLNEGVDPICEAAKSAQNAKFEGGRLACIAQEDEAKLECENRNVQELTSCEFESESEQSACVTGIQIARTFADQGSFAGTSLQLQTRGQVRAEFSGFQLQGDLETLQMNLGFNASLDLDGSVRFAPRERLGRLAECMNSWQSRIRGNVVVPQESKTLIGSLKPNQNSLIAQWSEYQLSASISPTPLEAMFVRNPRLLADCQIGLTVAKVSDAVTGVNAAYLSGQFMLEVQALPSRITLAPATVKYGKRSINATPSLDATHLRYEFLKQVF